MRKEVEILVESYRTDKMGIRTLSNELHKVCKSNAEWREAMEKALE